VSIPTRAFPGHASRLDDATAGHCDVVARRRRAGIVDHIACRLMRSSPTSGPAAGTPRARGFNVDARLAVLACPRHYAVGLARVFRRDPALPQVA